MHTAQKYSHIAVWPLLPGFTTPEGERSYPLAAIVANLAKPTPDHPALMRHHDVVTLFHEMGHIFHELLSKTRFSRFHGTRCVAHNRYPIWRLSVRMQRERRLYGSTITNAGELVSCWKMSHLWIF